MLARSVTETGRESVLMEEVDTITYLALHVVWKERVSCDGKASKQRWLAIGLEIDWDRYGKL